MTIRPFTPEVDPAVLRNLADRLEQTLWPPPAPTRDWSQGTDLEWLQSLCRDWAARVTSSTPTSGWLGYEHLLVDIEDVSVHVVRADAVSGNGMPLVLTHGWPSAFAEYLPVLDLLVDPAAHGLPGPGFDVTVASLPGYAWSTRPDRPITYAETARLWHLLMGELGYDRYGVGGGDFGSGVATLMALQQPDRVVGLHLGTLELFPDPATASPAPNAAEREWLDLDAAFWETGGGYKAIQSTRPQTLAYALTDSPSGLAGWIGEKWHEWVADPGVLDPDSPRASPDSKRVRQGLLDMLTLYWITGCIGPSMRDYADNRRHPLDLRGRRIMVPTAIPLFADAVELPPRSWVERLYDVVRWEPMGAGGHFAPLEAPYLFAADVCSFFSEVSS